MTAQLSRERLEEIRDYDTCVTLEESAEMARVLLAGMDSEPVAYMYRDNLHTDARFSMEKRLGNWSQEEINEYEITEIPLYTAPPAPVTYPDTLPCPVLLEPGMRFGKGVKTRVMLEAIQRRAEHYAELDAMTPEQRAENDAGIAEFRAMLPAPVAVPEPIKRNDADGWWMYKGRRVGGGCAEWYNRALDDCRAAMLQGDEPVTAATGWIKCSERMPELNKDVQVFCSDTREQFIAFRRIGGDFQYALHEGTSIVCTPTHWMPLPNPPKE